MTLAQRLLVATFVLTVVTTVALALGVREAWRTAEEQRFEVQFEAAVGRLSSEIAEERRALPSLLAPLCAHDPVLDAALVDLRGDRLDAGRRLSLSLRVTELMKAMRLDELVLFTGRGEILGAGHASGLVGSVDPRLLAATGDGGAVARVRNDPAPVAFTASCTRASGPVRLSLLGARRVDSVLARVGEGGGITLGLEPPADTRKLFVRTAKLAELGGLPVTASRSTAPLVQALGHLDRVVLLVGGVTLALALAGAWLLSRGLSRPIVRLSEQARRVVTGEPIPVDGGGGRELAELARAFNQTIQDLVQLRKRLAATERIAARREIARRVAHEIKNPLSPIRAAVETLRRLRARNDPVFDEYFDEATRTVLDEVARITTIVQEFTQFSRLPPPAPAPIDLAQAVRDVVGLHAATGARIEARLEDVGPVVADRDQLVQVLTNLLQNAMDAIAGREGGRVAVELARVDAERVRLVVADDGPGIAEEMRGRLFEPYATTKPHGTGLGLAIVERIVVEHGGEIACDEPPGGGARFTVVLPVSGPTLLPEPPPPSSRAPA